MAEPNETEREHEHRNGARDEREKTKFEWRNGGEDEIV